MPVNYEQREYDLYHAINSKDLEVFKAVLEEPLQALDNGNKLPLLQRLLALHDCGASAALIAAIDTTNDAKLLMQLFDLADKSKQENDVIKSMLGKEVKAIQYAVLHGKLEALALLVERGLKTLHGGAPSLGKNIFACLVASCRALVQPRTKNPETDHCLAWLIQRADFSSPYATPLAIASIKTTLQKENMRMALLAFTTAQWQFSTNNTLRACKESLGRINISDKAKAKLHLIEQLLDADFLSDAKRTPQENFIRKCRGILLDKASMDININLPKELPELWQRLEEAAAAIGKKLELINDGNIFSLVNAPERFQARAHEQTSREDNTAGSSAASIATTSTTPGYRASATAASPTMTEQQEQQWLRIAEALRDHADQIIKDLLDTGEIPARSSTNKASPAELLLLQKFDGKIEELKSQFTAGTMVTVANLITDRELVPWIEEAVRSSGPRANSRR